MHGTSRKETQPAEPIPHQHACLAALGGGSEMEPILALCPAGTQRAAVIPAATPSCRSRKEVSLGAAGDSLLWSYSHMCRMPCRGEVLCLVSYLKILAVTRT